MLSHTWTVVSGTLVFSTLEPATSSPPTSTTRSPSDLSPESDSCPDFRRSSVFRRLADISSFGVDERIGLRAEIGDRGRWFRSLGPSRGSLLWRGEYFELREEMMRWWLVVTCLLGSLRRPVLPALRETYPYAVDISRVQGTRWEVY